MSSSKRFRPAGRFALWLAIMAAVVALIAPGALAAPNGTANSGQGLGLGIWSPFQFGAKGDCSTDDYVAIRNAISSAAAAGQNAEVYFPSVTTCYLVGTTITVPANVALVGAGPGSTTIEPKANLNADVIANASTAGGFTIRDMTLNGNSANESSGNCLNLASASGVVLSNLVVTSCKQDGILLNGMTRVNLDNVDATKNGNSGIHVEGASKYVNGANVHAYDNGQTSGDGIQIEGTTTYTSLTNLSAFDDQGGSATQRYGVTEASKISSTVTISAAGSGYTSNPTCAIAAPGGGGTTATCTATESAGAVNSITVSNAGSGYTAAPSCTISGGGGSGATCTTALASGPDYTIITGLGATGNTSSSSNFLGAHSQLNDNSVNINTAHTWGAAQTFPAGDVILESGTPTGAGALGYSSSQLNVGDGSTNHSVVTTDQTQTLTNKTLTNPVVSSISNTGTLTLPTSTDTLVGRATTDTLTNKTLTAPVIGGSCTAGTAGSTGLSSSQLQISDGSSCQTYASSAQYGVGSTGAISLTASTSKLSSPVTLTSASTLYPVVSLSGLTGTYQLSAQALLNVTTGDQVLCLIGPTSGSSTGAIAMTNNYSSNIADSMTIAPYMVTLTSATEYLNCEDLNTAGKSVAVGGNGSGTYITAVRLS